MSALSKSNIKLPYANYNSVFQFSKSTLLKNTSTRSFNMCQLRMTLSELSPVLKKRHRNARNNVFQWDQL